MRNVFFVVIAATLFVIGIQLGRVSIREETVPLLPTRLPATPANYVEQINATPEPYWLITPTPMGSLTEDQARGRELYQTCVHCHGERGEGEPGNPNPNIPDQYGYMPVPRHDSLGHTWMHPDQLLVKFILNGMQNPLYRNIMPAYSEIYTEEDVMLLLDYIKLWWTDEQREQQAAATRRLELARDE
ncbi:MAG: cytochrome c [Chloroflexi bacterium]|nr:cytochrome c [Chloroflexota bacterium]